jgi:hypothetical protein
LTPARRGYAENDELVELEQKNEAAEQRALSQPPLGGSQLG